MNEIVFDRESHVAADGAGFGFDRVCCAHHHADGFCRVGAGNSECDDWAAAKVSHNIIEEGSFFVFGVVSFDGFTGGIE